MSESGLPAPAANPSMLGQARLMRQLGRAIETRRLGHALGFFGGAGIGKETLAYRLARTLLTGEPPRPGLEVDQEHRVARQIAAGGHPDLMRLEVPAKQEAKSQRAEIHIDQVRDAIERMFTTSMGGVAKVLLVDGGEVLNRNAGNALLKLLEEPPPATYILVLAEHPKRLLPTTRSRLLPVWLEPVGEDEMLAFLDTHWPGREEGERQALLWLAQGRPGRLARLIEEGWLDRYTALIERIGAGLGTVGARLRLADELAALFKAEGVTLVVDLLVQLSRRAVRAAAGGGLVPLVEGEAASLALIGRTLDQPLLLWEKLSRLAGEAEHLSLDRRHLLLETTSILAGRA